MIVSCEEDEAKRKGIMESSWGSREENRSSGSSENGEGQTLIGLHRDDEDD